MNANSLRAQALVVLVLALAFGSAGAGQAGPDDLPATKAERTALARKLVSRLEGLTFLERRTLERLGAEGFAELVHLTELRLEQYRTVSRRVRNPLTDPEAATAYWRFHYSLKELAYPTPEDPQSLLDLFQRIGTAGRMVTLRRDVLELVVNRDDKPVVALFLKDLADPRSPYRDLSLRWVMQSHDLRASAWRAPSNLLEEKAAAPAAGPDMRRTLPPLAVLMGLDQLPLAPVPDDDADFPRHLGGTQLVSVERDRDGTLWGWIRSEVLGEPSDRWIARYDGKRWTDLTYVGWFQEPVPDWRVRFVHDRSLRRDADHDGWSDLVERRVGTDPRRADTDKDGLKDSIDRNPLAAPRPLNDLERLLLAAGEACGRSYGSSLSSEISLPEGTAPMEVPWCGGITVAAPPDPNPSITTLQGGNHTIGVSFFGPLRDFHGNTTGRQIGKLALWNDTRTEARIGVGVSLSPMAGTTFDVQLKRVGPRWIVTEVKRIRTA